RPPQARAADRRRVRRALRAASRRLTADLSDVESDLRKAVSATLEAAGVEDGHIGLELVGEGRMRTLNFAHRGRDEATDVLAFPIDPDESGLGPRELGDVFICPEHSTDVIEAAVHGTLHLCGYDHETDKGEMLALQAKVLASLR
ncbi:MAG: rRNA maturation RNase YbeY, partial [Solirubrobacterales bacterium]|nr:rRNA maturation RNase YbeY [Solirubrobacterales bacterium]